MEGAFNHAVDDIYSNIGHDKTSDYLWSHIIFETREHENDYHDREECQDW